MPPYLDHIVILLPYAKLLALPAWIAKNFSLTPGGQHTDHKTENKLICFEDGSYIELISFVNDDPAHRKGHRWGDRKFGIIDFAFSYQDVDAEENWEAVNERLSQSGSNMRYEKPVPGGRMREDGKEIKWKVTSPNLNSGVQRGELPFFCHDLTPRELRVPSEHVTHPTAAYGVKEMSIFVPEDRVAVLLEAYEAILDVPNEGGVFEVDRRNNVQGVKYGGRFCVQSPTEELQIVSIKEKDGVLLGDLLIGSLSGEKRMGRVQIDVPIEEGVGRIFLEFEVPVTE
jgi:hypothetical protein